MKQKQTTQQLNPSESLLLTAQQATDILTAMKNGVDEMDEMRRRFSEKRVSLQGGDNLLHAIPRAFRDQVYLAEVADAQFRRGETVTVGDRQIGRGFCAGDPVKKTAIGAYLHLHLLRLSRPGDFYKHAEAFQVLRENLSVEKVALQEDTATEGGNLVPVIVEGEMLRLIADNGIMRRAGVRVVTMTTKTHAYPTRAAAFTAAIIPEEGSITDSVPSNPFNQSNLTAKKFGCFATVSGEVMQDNVVLLGDYLGTEFSEQIARAEDTQALEGDGTGNNFTGVVAASGVNSVSSGANGDFLSYQKLVEALFASGESSSIDNQAVFMHHKVASAIYRSRSGAASATDQGGLPLLAPAGGITVGPTRAILGFPFYAHSGILVNRTVGTGTNRTNIYCGAPRTIIFGDLLGFSVDLNPYSKFSSFQIDIRGVKRTGILVAVPAAWTKYTAIDPLGAMAV